MIKVAVCDDDKEELGKIRLALGRIEEDMHSQLWVKEFHGGRDLLSFQERERFDIYLMDTIMPDLNGIQVARNLRKRGDKGFIIYLSSSKDFGVESYEVNAFHYLIKPISIEKLRTVLTCAISELQKLQQQSILIKTQEMVQKVKVKDIVYVESVDHNKEIHLTRKRTLYTRTTMERLWEMLYPTGYFIIPHRSYIVNMDYIFHMDGKELILNDDTKIIISRGALASVQEAYARHSFFYQGSH